MRSLVVAALLSTPLAADTIGLDAVLVGHPNTLTTALSGVEHAAIQAFVAAGGGLFVSCAPYDAGLNDFLVLGFDVLLLPYGITFLSPAVDSTGRVISQLVPHPLTAGVGSIGTSNQRWVRATPGLSSDLTVLSGNEDVLAVGDATTVSGTLGGTQNLQLCADTGLSLVGITANHVAVVLNPASLSPHFVSNPATVTIAP